MHNGTNDELAELNELIAKQEGRLANEAADASLRHLVLLGAMKADACHPAYRKEVAMALTRVAMTLAAVRQCVEAVTPELDADGRMAFMARLIAVAFDVDAAPIIGELFYEARTAYRETN
jgi:hypothetical protein